MNQSVEIYKLIVSPDEDDKDIQWVDEFGWIKDEFVVWVSKYWWTDFISKLTDILGYSIFDEGGFDAKIQEDCICFVLSDITSDIDFEEIFPKDKYQH